MNEITKYKDYKTNDYKNDFINLFSQGISTLVQDDFNKFNEILKDIMLTGIIYNYYEKSEIDIKISYEEIKEEEQEENTESNEEESVEIEEENVYKGEDISNVLSNEIKDKEYKESEILISEVPLYTFKIYDGSKYSVPDDIILNNAKIIIPSNDGYYYYLKVIVTADNVLYAEKKEFQKEYAYIKAAYIREMTEPDTDRYEINKIMDNLVDVSLLETESKIVKWENNDYVCSARPKSSEMIKLEGNRQRLMDNRNIRFMYDINGAVYHDKSCVEIKNISLSDLRGSENPPKDKAPCESCLLDMYIRKACVDDFKNQTLYRHFLTKGDVSMNTLKEFTGKPNARFRIESVNKLKVTCNEDTWKIETDGRGNFIRLWHNNYFVDKRGKRHIDNTEYHEQQSDMIMNVQMAFQYIMDYDFKGNH